MLKKCENTVFHGLIYGKERRLCDTTSLKGGLAEIGCSDPRSQFLEQARLGRPEWV